MSTEKLIITTSDEKEFEVEISVCKRISETLKNMIEDIAADPDAPKNIPLDFSFDIISKVFAFAAEEDKLPKPSLQEERDKIVKEFYTKYFSKYPNTKDVDIHNEMVNLTFAANHLEYKSLLECMASGVASILKACTNEQLRDRFNIKDDLTDAEKQALEKEMEWAMIDTPATS